MNKITKCLYTLLFFAAPLVIASCESSSPTQASKDTPPAQEETPAWATAADMSQEALLTHFWSPNAGYFLKANNGDSTFNYWWQAHALDAFCDAYRRTNDAKYLALMSDLLDGVKRQNGGTFSNNYYDDMEWMALACLRTYDLTKDEKYKTTAETLWEDIKTGWSDYLGGGISWKKDQRDYKNTPANAPASILASRLYQLNQNEEDLAWAKKIYDWQKQNLVDPATGLVWDGMNRQGNNQIDKDWLFTYCQGVYIGAGLALYQITNEQAYLDDAVQTADYVLNDRHFTTAEGVLKEHGGGDGGLFKGILVRYLTELALEEGVSEARRNAYIAFLQKNGEQLWEKGTSKPAILFSSDWSTLPKSPIESSTQLSGVMLTEALARLDSLGLL
ncbi:glycoside hydrolase family 76 protein [Pontibacter saemangeumensis]|uniref:Glycoside hydrolase family 76 protein n=1 Tax=Pontibacter saemangeumensis TaxID=1084525 RepID=A0ABP8M1P3_9BACT